MNKPEQGIPSLASHLLAMGALWLLLLMSAATQWMPHSGWITVITTSIAVAQACIVLVVFMRLKSSSNLLRFVAIFSFCWPLLLVVFSLGDYMTRSPLRWPW
ncbi:hypothetical protein [Dyella acidiphila]|uniref:Oxidase n=1 Tax=Dyella acidiphila TaxID=2775866 RepID=A0ABR9GBZ6_9GAMM|nr:hypothetical protein [Dyella acidiphila]MBE1161543.1 hypothetical protein [Dyella acidiphila]